jgi:hypothetical protein
MTEIYRSPIVKISLKRGYDDDELVDNLYYKRSKFSSSMDIESSDIERSMDRSPEFDDSIQRRMKRTRDDMKETTTIKANTLHEEFNKHVTLLHAQFEAALKSKETEMSHVQVMNEGLYEENRILKKAVAIQDQKLRESYQQGQQLQEILAQVMLFILYILL